jgi:2-haloacid dehalogenase
VNYEWVLLDADGTLFDYDRAEQYALERALQDFDLPFNAGTVEVYRRINGALWLDFEQGKVDADRLKVLRFERLLEAMHAGGRADPARFSAMYLHHLGACAELIDGAAQVVRTLHTRTRLALITNGLKEVQRSRLAKSGLKPFFEVVVISDELGVAKPDPGIFDVAFLRMGEPDLSEVLIVGDSLTSDMKGGYDYGIDTCWFNPDHAPREPSIDTRYEIDVLSELLAIVA